MVFRYHLPPFTMIRSLSKWRLHIPFYDYLIFAVFVVFIDQNGPINYALEWLVILLLLYWNANPQHHSLVETLTEMSLAFAPLNISVIILANVWMHFIHHVNPNMNSQIADYGSTLFILVELPVALGLMKMLRKPFRRFLKNVHQAGWLIVVILISFGFEVLESVVVQKVLVLPTPVLTCIFIGYFLLFALAVWDIGLHYQKRHQIDALSYELNNLRPYTSEIEAMYDNLRRFRHDYKNILFSLQEAASNDNTQQVKQILGQVITPSEKELSIGTDILARLDNIEDLAAKSLIYNKLRQAISQKINVQIEIPQKVSLANYMSLADGIRILAILLDNAIAGAKKTTEKKLNLSLFTKDQQLYIIVANDTVEEQVQLPNENQSVVNFNSSHGLGRRNLRIILARYPQAVAQVKANHHRFEQTIVFQPQK